MFASVRLTDAWGTVSLSDCEVFPASEREGPAADIISFINVQDEGEREGGGGTSFSLESVNAAASQRNAHKTSSSSSTSD